MIIGFCGAIGTGKTCAARHLEQKFGFKRVSFAGPIKDMCLALGLTNDDVNGDYKHIPHSMICKKTPRQFMQLLGTDFGRNMIGADIWVNAWRARAQQLAEIVADDVRFPNEVKTIHELGGRVIRLARQVEQDPAVARHASEQQELTIDYVINNDGDRDQLFASVEQAIYGYRSPLWSSKSAA